MKVLAFDGVRKVKGGRGSTDLVSHSSKFRPADERGGPYLLVRDSAMASYGVGEGAFHLLGRLIVKFV